jgi:GR25 family glycosyltransferase involved in LPS biosynthesis
MVAINETPLIYVINLERRADRRVKVTNSLKSLNINFEIITAIDAETLRDRQAIFNLSLPAQACWESHVLAIQAFLKTRSSHAIIFEDDVILSKWRAVEKIISRKDFSNFDLVQFGFVNTGLIDRIHRNLVNFESTIFQSLFYFTRLKPMNFFKKRLRVQRRVDMGFNIIAHDIRAGAQAYMISRNLAHIIVSNSTTPLVPFDGLLMSLNWISKFKVGRTLKNLIPQDNSPSSIKGFS